jgi:hypothetical protein
MHLSPSLAAMTGDTGVYFIELTHLAHIEMPFGDAYLWIVCEQGGGYFSKTDYMNRATYFESRQRAEEFLEVFPFIKGKVVTGDAPARRYLFNSFERHVLFHMYLHNVFDSFPQGALSWKTLLSGLLLEKSSASDPPSASMASNCPEKPKSSSKASAASSLPAPSESPQLFLW